MTMETTAPAPAAPQMETSGQPNVNAPEKMVRDFKVPEKPDLSSIQFQLKNLDTEVSTALTKINSIRKELGLSESNEIPPALAKKQAKLLQARDTWTMPQTENTASKNTEKSGEYISFEEIKNEPKDQMGEPEYAEEIPDPEAQKNEQTEQIKNTIEEVFEEIKILPKEELEHFKMTGTYINGALFHCKILGLIQPRTMQKLVLLSEEPNQILEIEAITTLKEQEPELFLEIEKHTEAKHEREQKALPEAVQDSEEQKKLPEDTDQKMIDEAPQQNSIEMTSSATPTSTGIASN